MDHEEGSVVIVATGQAGTVIQTGKYLWVLLANGDVWVGSFKQALPPQSPEHLAACPMEVERFVEREKAKRMDRD